MAGTVSDRITRALLAEERERLRLTVRARTAALVVIMLLVLAVSPFPDVLYYQALILIFILAGLAQYRLDRSEARRGWHKYAFATFDFALLAFTLLYPNPFSTIELPPQMLLRFGNFLYFFVLLAGLAFSFHPMLVIWGGVCGAAFWSLGVALIAQRDDTIIDPDIVLEAANTPKERADALLEIFFSPTFIDLGVRLQEVVLLLVVASLLAVVVGRSRALIRKQAYTERRNANLSRYFSPEMADELSERDQPFASQTEANAAVLFTDIVGFSGWAESRPPQEVIALLREAHEIVETAVFAHGGVLDKFIGDGAMATFGAARPDRAAAARALACVDSILTGVSGWNAARARNGDGPVGLSVGLHYGPVVVGEVGSERRMELAVIGDTVNVASRIEHLTRPLGCAAAVSQEAIDAAGDGASHGFASAGPQKIHGRAAPVTVWTRGEIASA